MLDGIPIANLTAPTLLGIVVLLVIFGRLVPWYIYKQKAEEAEKWRLAFETERTARIKTDAYTTELLEYAKTTHSVIVAALDPPTRVRQSGEANVVSAPTPK